MTTKPKQYDLDSVIVTVDGHQVKGFTEREWTITYAEDNMTELSEAGQRVLDTIVKGIDVNNSTSDLTWSAWDCALDITEYYKACYRHAQSLLGFFPDDTLGIEYAYSFDELPEADQEAIKEILSRAIKTNGKSLEKELLNGQCKRVKNRFFSRDAKA